MDSKASRVGILLVCCLSLFIVGLDVTAVNIALPSIGRDLHPGVSGLQWTVDAYTVVLASLLMFGGSTGDRFGRRRTFVTGLGVFAAGSLLCSVAPSAGLLVAFRVVQAVGASMLNPVAMSIIANTFTDPRERAQAVGVWGAVFGISMALGPVVGGTLVSAVVNSIDNFNYITSAVLTPLFLVAGTFFPINQLPEGLQVAANVNPLHQLVELVRHASFGFKSTDPLRVAFLVFFAVSLWRVAVRRMSARLID